MPRHLSVRGRLVAVLSALFVLAPAATARPAAVGPSAPEPPAAAPAHVDPGLWSSVAAGTAPAILSYDEGRVTRGEVRSYLERSGVAFHMFSMLPMAAACAAGPAEVSALAGAPGAISVWGEERMIPTLDESVPTAFNGDPNAVWSGQGITGKGVGIAVIDTGIDATHPDLAFESRTKLNARVLVSHREITGPGNDACVPDQFQEDLEDSELTSGHGTYLASVAAGDGTASDGQLKGMAPEADLVGVSVAEQATPERDFGGGTEISLIRFLAAVNYVLSNGLEGGPTVVKVALLGWSSPNLYDPWHPHALAVRDLYDFGISVVMPVGNGGPDTSQCDEADTCHFNGLAVGPFPIAVGATPKDSRTGLEDYSSRGDPEPRVARGQEVVYEPTLVAPGTGVVAARRLGLVGPDPGLPSAYPVGASGEVPGDPTDLDYQALTGTSVSAAHVAGAIALMQQAAVEANGCYLTPEQVIEVLRATATPMDGYESWEVGAGALDATAAVTGSRLPPEEVEQRLETWMCPPGAGPATQ